MKKNAFTLIELIATIGLLGMLATILITVSVKKINETKEHSKKSMIESIELATKQYVTDYKDELSDFQKKDYIYVTLQTLVEKNYFSNSLIDPTTNKSLPLTDTVYVTREQNGEINAVYDINQKGKAKLTLNGSYNEYLKEGENFTDLGINATAIDGTNISSSVTTTGTVDSTTPGTYKITYKYNDVSITRNVIVYEGNLPTEIKIPVFITYNANEGTFGTTKYDYTGGEQTYTVPVNGYYKLEVWGAQGHGAGGGKGGYVSGKIKLTASSTNYIFIGGKPTGQAGGYNGGGAGYSSTAGGGGGATDIRYNGTSLNDRIIVAGGGGGNSKYNAGNSGGLIGVTGYDSNYSSYTATGGTQISGGVVTNYSSSYTAGTNGTFGVGGVGGGASGGGSFGGGGGYYGGAGGSRLSSGNWPGGGGSSYISGHTGCIAISSASSITARTGTNGDSCVTGTTDNLCSVHYSGMKFTDTLMIDGSGYVWTNTKGSLQQMPNPNGGYYSSGVGHADNGAAIISQITYEQKAVYLESYPINNIPIPTREEYTFIGWFTDPVGGEQITSSTIINNQSDHEIYAHWQATS